MASSKHIISPCALCGNNSPLNESHVIPKFVYNWMKKTGTGRFRQMYRLNTPIQDGIKRHMLCDNCESLFSAKEKWFNESVFTPYLSNRLEQITCTENLKFFIVSILWRVIEFFNSDNHLNQHQNEINQAKKSWANYLLFNNEIDSSSFHIIFIPEDIKPNSSLNNFFTYLLRSVDIDIAENDFKCFVYAKFSRFMLIGTIKGMNDKNFDNTKVENGNTIEISQQYFSDLDLADFIKHRIENIKSYDDLSEEQKRKNDALYNPRLNDLKNTDYWNALRKDKKQN